jgi:tRNA(Ile)-lysidine synthase
MKTERRTLEEQFEQHLGSRLGLRRGDSILLAVSGGLDSMALLTLFKGIRERWNLQLAIAHVNHQLRGEESDRDEEFVREEARALDVPTYVERTDTAAVAHELHLSKQQAARQLRYEFFERARRACSASYVATAHQADDNAETVLLNVLRGTGIRGLAGIPLFRSEGSIIRPLLFARRSDLEEFVRTNAVPFRHDSSNDSLHYTRNYLRKMVVPSLHDQLRTDVVDLLNRFADSARRLDDHIDRAVASRWDRIAWYDSERRLHLSIPALLAEPTFIAEHVALRALRGAGVHIHAEKVRALVDLCSQPTGRSVQLSRSWSVYRDRDHLVFLHQQQEEAFELSVSMNGTLELPPFRLTLHRLQTLPTTFEKDETSEYIDAEKLGRHLVVRPWHEGDVFFPIGLNRRKKVSDFLIDQKVPRFEKRRVPLLVSDGEIVWICGRRLDHRFRITPQTRVAAKLTYTPTIHS